MNLLGIYLKKLGKLNLICPVCKKDCIKLYVSGVGYICYAHELRKDGSIISMTACTQSKKAIKTKDN